MKTKTYPRYKPSGVEWLGDVPEHWETWKISHGFELTGSGTTPPSDETGWYDGTVPWITTSELRENKITTTEKSVTEEAVRKFSALKKFPVGSLGIAMYGATIGRLGILGIEATTNQACCVMFGGKIFVVPFVFYWMQAFKESIILLASGGGQPNISQDKIKSIKISCPQIHEQQAIAAFLDRQTGTIDALIARKQQLLELLKEQRTAMISRAVTKGLNPKVKMKPSGVEWLGDVPEHWEVARLRRLSVRVTDGAHISPDLSSQEYPFVSTVDISDGNIDFNNCIKTSEECYEYLKQNGCKPVEEDVLFSKDGTVGRTSVINFSKDFVVASSLIIISPRKQKINSKYLNYWLNNSLLQQYVNLQISGAAIKRVSVEKIGRLPIASFSLSEQQAIVEYLDRETGKIDALASKVETAIEKLKEYRTALISAAVTGKIDVREAV